MMRVTLAWDSASNRGTSGSENIFWSLFWKGNTGKKIRKGWKVGAGFGVVILDLYKVRTVSPKSVTRLFAPSAAYSVIMIISSSDGKAKAYLESVHGREQSEPRAERQARFKFQTQVCDVTESAHGFPIRIQTWLSPFFQWSSIYWFTHYPAIFH